MTLRSVILIKKVLPYVRYYIRISLSVNNKNIFDLTFWGREKRSPFCRHFQIHHLVWKLLHFDSNFPEIGSHGPKWQYASFGSDNGLVPMSCWTNNLVTFDLRRNGVDVTLSWQFHTPYTSVYIIKWNITYIIGCIVILGKKSLCTNLMCSNSSTLVYYYGDVGQVEPAFGWFTYISRWTSYWTWTWWRHQMETFSALLALCEGKPRVTGGSLHKGQWRWALMFVCSFLSAPEETVEQTMETPVIWDAIALIITSLYTVMKAKAHSFFYTNSRVYHICLGTLFLKCQNSHFSLFYTRY